jgi:hypothetical protein
MTDARMSSLRVIGYWPSKDEPDWPDPAWFVDPQWNPTERARVAAYRSAYVSWAQGGRRP